MQPKATHRKGAVSSGPTGPERLWLQIVTFAMGCLLGVAFLKFGNPVILDRLIEPPANGWEYVFQPWPLRWGYIPLGLCLLASVRLVRLKSGAPWPAIALPVSWFFWQCLASPGSIDPRLTSVTMSHFAACLVCFFLGLFVLSRTDFTRCFWLPLLIAFLLVLWTGFEQHYGGLEATRKMFFAQPGWQQAAPEYIKKIESNRIFATLVYPNALAAAILLLAPPLFLFAWRISHRLTDVTRAVLVGILAYTALACLFWSGSRSGWLIALLLGLTAIGRQRVSPRVKIAILICVMAGGLAGFFIKYSGYFRRGAPSVSARFEYWRAGWKTASANPVFGTGPGTFSASFRRIKPPEAEMAQLAHNDYLEQASDSGWVGMLTYTGFILGSVVQLARKRTGHDKPESFVVWLGLLGWALQSFVEFPLYIPALAWTAFLLLGWLWGRGERDQEPSLKAA